jgi:hypothetical protein
VAVFYLLFETDGRPAGSGSVTSLGWN